jgi:chemotaxis protein MotB
MPTQTWIIATILSATMIVAVMGLAAWQFKVEGDELYLALKESEAEALRSQSALMESQAAWVESQTALAEAQAAFTGVRRREAVLDELLSESRERIEELLQEKELVRLQQRTLEDEMRSALQLRDVTISELQGNLTVNILDRILFDSGEAVVKPEGQQVLREIAEVLAQYPSRHVHVIGHTDNVPIRASAQNRFPSNWELSAARAIAAVRFLSEQAGVDPQRLAAVGHGEFHPIADNSTAEGRAKNRRIALVVLPEEFVASDALVASPRAVTAEGE